MHSQELFYVCNFSGGVHVPHVLAPSLISQKIIYVLAPGLCEYSHYIHLEEGDHGANTCLKKDSRDVFFYIRATPNTGPRCIRGNIDSLDFL